MYDKIQDSITSFIKLNIIVKNTYSMVGIQINKNVIEKGCWDIFLYNEDFPLIYVW